MALRPFLHQEMSWRKHLLGNLTVANMRGLRIMALCKNSTLTLSAPQMICLRHFVLNANQTSQSLNTTSIASGLMALLGIGHIASRAEDQVHVCRGRGLFTLKLSNLESKSASFVKQRSNWISFIQTVVLRMALKNIGRDVLIASYNWQKKTVLLFTKQKLKNGHQPPKILFPASLTMQPRGSNILALTLIWGS